MITYDYSVFTSINENEISNNLFSDLWIYKVEKVFTQGSFFLKVFLVNKNEKLILDQIYFAVSYSDKIESIAVSDFKPLSTTENKTMFGCLIELNDDQGAYFNNITIEGYINDNNLIKMTNSNIGFSLSSDQKDKYKNSILSEQDKLYTIFPNFTKDYWQCKCGEINLLASDDCSNCVDSKNVIYNMYEKGLKNYFLSYIKEDSFPYNQKISSDRNLEVMIKEFNQLGYSENDIPKRFYDYLNDESLKHEKNIMELNKKEKFKNKMIIVLFAVLVVSIYIGTKGLIKYNAMKSPLYKDYEEAHRLSEKSNIQASQAFARLSNFYDSDKQELKFKYLAGMEFYEDEYFVAAKKIFEELGNYKNSEKMLKKVLDELEKGKE